MRQSSKLFYLKSRQFSVNQLIDQLTNHFSSKFSLIVLKEQSHVLFMSKLVASIPHGMSTF